MVKKTFQAFESINSDVRAKIKAQITSLGQDEHETDAKNRTLTNSDSELMNPFRMVKKYFSLLNRSVLMSDLGFKPKLRFWGKMSTKQTQKIGL